MTKQPAKLAEAAIAILSGLLGLAAAILLVSLLTGCSTLTGMVTKGAELNDAAVATAETTLCRGISIGAWMRAYGQDVNRAKAWKVLCDEKIGALP